MGWPGLNAEKYTSGAPLRRIAADDLRFLINFVKYLDGVGCYVEKTASGIGCKIVIPDSAPVERNPDPTRPGMPFDIETVTKDEITLVEGSVEVHTVTGTTLITPGSMTVSWGGTGTRYVYVEANIVSSTASIAEGSGFPASTSMLYRKCLYRCEVTATSALVTLRYHAGNVEFVGWRP